jgi:two-component system, NtrC family, sensor histidine kinase HydH
MDDLRARTTLFCGIIAFAIALSVLLRGRRATNLLFAAFAGSLGAWYLSQALADLFKSPSWVRVTAVLTVLMPQFAVRTFASALPGERVPAGKPRLTRWAEASAVPALLLVLSPYAETAPALAIIYIYVVGLLAAALVTLALRGQYTESRAIRGRIRFLVAVGTLSMTFTATDFLSYLGLYFPPIGAVLAIAFLFVLAESLQRTRLADLYELAGRLMVSTTLAFALAGIFYGFLTYIGRFGAMYLNAVLAAIVFLVLFEPLRTALDKRIHQFFFRERYDLETSMLDLRRRLAHALEVDEIARELITGLERSRRVTSAALYLRDSDGFGCVGSLGAAPVSRLEVLVLRPLLEHHFSSIDLEERLREPRDSDALLVTAASTLGPFRNGVIVAIRGDDDELVGLLCLQDDRIRDAFSPEEVTLFETLVGQVGVAVQNTRVYAKVKERDRLAGLGAMAAGLAHEVKNPLGSIKGAAQLLEELTVGHVADPQVSEFIGIIIEETDRLNRVVGSFLDYARPRTGVPVPLDVNSAVRRTVQILGGTETTGKVQLVLADKLPFASIDAEQLRQVLINLVQNAIQAMNGDGVVTISTQVRTPLFPESDRQGRLRPDSEFVEISVRDTGLGKTCLSRFLPPRSAVPALDSRFVSALCRTLAAPLKYKANRVQARRSALSCPSQAKSCSPRR